MAISHLVSVIPFVAVALAAITFHEAAHAWVAAACGDDTARKLRRVTFNPIRHIDPVGTVLLPAVLYAIHAPLLFGWAKPVPVDWSKLRHWRRDAMLVAAAGPGANFALAGLSVGALRGFGAEAPPWLAETLSASIGLNMLLGVFNLIPIPPLDGSKVLAGLLPEPWALRFLGLRRRQSADISSKEPENASKPPAPDGV